MKVNDPNLSSLASTGASGTQQTSRTGQSARPAETATPNSTATGDDIHLSELVRSLRSLAADSPERQAHIEQLARAYADGTYKVDPEATASKMIDDAFQHS
ncbi:MAG TPA: flagellar biosynthesis anti-sigma factor FlgM [Bryobacteraceae bacterium]|jgi:flagellar biosynthesis anti-sigma factor FlgM